VTPEIPGYLLAFESTVRPLVAAIALGLIWMGAARMPASAKSRYATAGVLSAVLIGWVAVAQYLGAANTYFATTDTPFRNRRPCRGNHHGGNDFSGTGASSCVRGAEPSHVVLSAGHGAHLRRSAGPDAPWPRSMAAAARCRLSRAAGGGLMPLVSSTTPGEGGQVTTLPLRSRHSITSSARASSVGGTSKPSARAVFRLMPNLK